MSIKPFAAGVLVALAISPLTSVAGNQTGFTEKGAASYYADKFQGRRTASGERYDTGALTAAHRTLPLGTKVRVTNRQNGNSVVVEINDRGPHARGRLLDLSKRAAQELRMINSGVAQVQLEVVSQGDS
jgi:rare lipoprotein A